MKLQEILTLGVLVEVLVTKVMTVLGSVGFAAVSVVKPVDPAVDVIVRVDTGEKVTTVTVLPGTIGRVLKPVVVPAEVIVTVGTAVNVTTVTVSVGLFGKVVNPVDRAPEVIVLVGCGTKVTTVTVPPGEAVGSVLKPAEAAVDVTVTRSGVWVTIIVSAWLPTPGMVDVPSTGPKTVEETIAGTEVMMMTGG
jgi:hypothetical protein